MIDFFRNIISFKFSIILIFVTYNSLAQENINSKQNKTQKDEIQTIFVPFFQKEVDEQFIYTFNQKPYTLASTDNISQNLLNELLKNSWFKKSVDELNQNIKTKKNLYSNLTENEILDFKKNTSNSEIIILHSSIESKKITKINGSGNLIIYCTIAVYNLKSGEFLFSCYEKNNSNFKKESENTNISFEKLSQELFNCFKQKLK